MIIPLPQDANVAELIEVVRVRLIDEQARRLWIGSTTSLGFTAAKELAEKQHQVCFHMTAPTKQGRLL